MTAATTPTEPSTTDFEGVYLLQNSTLTNNDSLYPISGTSHFDNDTFGESHCSGSNSSMLDTFNVSTSATPTSINDYGEHHDNGQDELYEVPLSMIIFLSILYGGISVSALVGNTLVLWVVAVSRRMRTVTNMFIANLALADIIIGLFTIPFQFQAALLQRWNLPEFMCAFCPFVQVLSVNVSVFTLSAIAVDRYRAVLHPLSARVSKRKATWAILSIWAIGFLLALPTELDYKVTQYHEKGGGKKPFCANLGLPASFRMFYHQGIVVIQYFFPLIIITGAYVHMGTKLWGATAPGNKEESRDAVVLRNKKKVIKMLSVVVLLFGVCWAPLQFYNFFQTIFPSINEYQYINVLFFSFHSLAMSNSCVSPFIYAIYNDKFQREFQSRLRCLRRCSKSGDDANYSEGSDFDRSKIRASYRFSNNRFGASSVTNRSFYNNTTNRPNIGETSRRSSVYNGNMVQQSHRFNLQEFNDCQGPKRYLGVGTYTFQNQQQRGYGTHHHTHHHRHRNRRHRQRASGAGSSDGSGNNNSSGSSGSFSNEIAAELECSSRYINGDLREGTNNYLGSSINFETETRHQETSLTVMNAAVTVVTANGRAVTNGSGNMSRTVTVVTNDSNFRL